MKDMPTLLRRFHTTGLGASEVIDLVDLLEAALKTCPLQFTKSAVLKEE